LIKLQIKSNEIKYGMCCRDWEREDDMEGTAAADRRSWV